MSCWDFGARAIQNPLEVDVLGSVGDSKSSLAGGHDCKVMVESRVRIHYVLEGAFASCWAEGVKHHAKFSPFVVPLPNPVVADVEDWL